MSLKNILYNYLDDMQKNKWISPRGIKRIILYFCIAITQDDVIDGI